MSAINAILFIAMMGLWIYPIVDTDYNIDSWYAWTWIGIAFVTWVNSFFNRDNFVGILSLVLSTVLLTLFGIGFFVGVDDVVSRTVVLY